MLPYAFTNAWVWSSVYWINWEKGTCLQCSEGGGRKIQNAGYPWLQNKYMANLGYIRLCLNLKNNASLSMFGSYHLLMLSANGSIMAPEFKHDRYKRRHKHTQRCTHIQRLPCTHGPTFLKLDYSFYHHSICSVIFLPHFISTLISPLELSKNNMC